MRSGRVEPPAAAAAAAELEVGKRRRRLAHEPCEVEQAALVHALVGGGSGCGDRIAKP